PEAEAAVVGADAALARAVALRVRVAGGHAEVAPDERQVLARDAHQIDPLAAGELHERDGIFFGHVGDAAELGRARDTAGDLWDDAVRPVFLDVRVYAIVDEARVALVGVLVGPDAVEQRGEPGLAGRVLH